jgi:hypothetical protein
MATQQQLVKAGMDETHILDSSGNVLLRVYSGGGVANDAPDDGSGPLKVGSVATATVPASAANGDRIQFWVNSKGALVISGQNLTTTRGLGNSYLGFQRSDAGASTGTPIGVYPLKFNGATWDADCKPSLRGYLASSAASVNSTLVAAGSRDLFRVIGRNTNAAVRYLKLYNKATAPTVGTDTPLLTLALLPTSVFNFEIGGLYFGLGLGFGLTTGEADSDTGAVSAGDITALNLLHGV